jgi:hypothetical protein
MLVSRPIQIALSTQVRYASTPFARSKFIALVILSSAIESELVVIIELAHRFDQVQLEHAELQALDLTMSSSWLYLLPILNSLNFFDVWVNTAPDHAAMNSAIPSALRPIKYSDGDSR